MPHIISYILPLFVAQRGNLWRFSSAKLESRGGRVKRIARATVCWQPRGVYQRTIKKTAKGGADASNAKVIVQRVSGCGSKNILDRVVLTEDALRDGRVRPKQSKRFRETGRVKKPRELAKTRALPDGRIHIELSCERIFEAQYDGLIPRIYTEKGQLNPDYAQSAQFDMVQQ